MSRKNKENRNENTQSSKFSDRIDDFVNDASGKIIDAGGVAKDSVKKAMDTVMSQLDVNGDGRIGIEDIIVLAIKTPGVYINRAKFLQNELFKNHPQDVIEKAIRTTPALAGIPTSEIDKNAEHVIKRERIAVSGISTVLGTPGGLAMAATIPADIAQYYGYTLRAVQKLLYLYGFPEIDSDEEGLQLDSETINAIIVCLGIMNGVAGANNAIKAMAKALSVGVEKQLMKMALTKGAVYPIVKQVMKWFGVTLTKSLFAGAVRKAIPVVGGVVGGGITFATFKPCCYRLKDALKDTMLSNPNHVSSAEEEALFSGIMSGEIIEATFEEIPADPKDELSHDVETEEQTD